MEEWSSNKKFNFLLAWKLKINQFLTINIILIIKIAFSTTLNSKKFRPSKVIVLHIYLNYTYVCNSRYNYRWPKVTQMKKLYALPTRSTKAGCSIHQFKWNCLHKLVCVMIHQKESSHQLETIQVFAQGCSFGDTN